MKAKLKEMEERGKQYVMMYDVTWEKGWFEERERDDGWRNTYLPNTLPTLTPAAATATGFFPSAEEELGARMEEGYEVGGRFGN